VVNNLSINVMELLIRQKPLTFGYGSQEVFIDSPMSPAVLVDMIYKHWYVCDYLSLQVQVILEKLLSYRRSLPILDRLFEARVLSSMASCE
jgi:hypothetical protein